MKVSLVLIFLVCLSFFGCSPSSVSGDELQQYIADEKNGLAKTIVRENISVALFYRPVELVTLHEMKINNSQTLPDNNNMKYKDYAYFILRLAKNNEEFLNQFARREERYPEALTYFSGGIKDHLLLSCENLRIAPDVITLIQSFGISDHTDVVVVFRTSGLHEKSDFKITLADSKFIPGFYEFFFEAKKIRCIPLLNPLSYEVI